MSFEFWHSKLMARTYVASLIALVDLEPAVFFGGFGFDFDTIDLVDLRAAVCFRDFDLAVSLALRLAIMNVINGGLTPTGRR